MQSLAFVYIRNGESGKRGDRNYLESKFYIVTQNTNNAISHAVSEGRWMKTELGGKMGEHFTNNRYKYYENTDAYAHTPTRKYFWAWMCRRFESVA